MRVSIRKITIAAGSALLGAVSLAPATALAAPGAISDVPLFLTSPVEPNILFLVDDSGSMDWGLMTDEDSGALGADIAAVIKETIEELEELLKTLSPAK